MGRPSDFTQELADDICERLSNGEGLRSICRDDVMPSKSTVCRWLAEKQEFRDQYAHAREMLADLHFEETIEIADDGAADYTLVRPDGFEVKVDSEHIQRSKLRVDIRKWTAARLAPKKYGDSVQVKHADAEGGKLPTSDVDRTARIAALMAAAQQRADAAE